MTEHFALFENRYGLAEDAHKGCYGIIIMPAQARTNSKAHLFRPQLLRRIDRVG
jgi:hypothetical protein